MPRQDDDYAAKYGRTSTTGQARPGHGTAVPAPRPAARPAPVRKPVDTTPGTQGGYYTFINSTPGMQPQSVEGLNASMAEYYNQVANGTLGMPTSPGGLSVGGGGGRGYGGGGGGGGSALTQAMIDAMAKALGAQGPQYSYTPVDLPDFQGTNMAAFDPSMWQQALGQINTAVSADQANINRGQQQVTTQLQNNYTNPYATATVTPGAQASQIGAGLTGGMTDPSAANQVNAGNADSQAAFQNLLGVLAAADQSAQNSRMAQVPMDAQYATQGLNAQALGMRGQVGMAQTQAQQQWAQADAERRYQNSLMAQQWNREEQQANAAGANQAAQTNYQANSAAQTARLQPILDLIMQSGGRGLDLSALFSALGIAA